MNPAAPPRRAVVYKLHSEPALCRGRVAQLRALNPGVPVFGMWGGPPDQHAKVAAALLGVFDDLYCLRPASPWTKWTGGDLCLREWFLAVGQRHSFDVVHLVEWDLLLGAPLTEAYAAVPPGAVGLTGLTPLSAIEKRWFWTRQQRHAPEVPKLRAQAAAALGWSGELLVCLGPGPCFPRGFVERLAAAPLIDAAHDELRFPLLAQAYGFPLADNGFYRAWFDPAEERYFNCEGAEIARAIIEAELAKPGGRRAFHPVRTEVPLPVSGAPRDGAASGG